MPRKKQPAIEAILPPVDYPEGFDDTPSAPVWDIELFQNLCDLVAYLYNSVQMPCMAENITDCPHCQAEALLDRIYEEAQLCVDEVEALKQVAAEECSGFVDEDELEDLDEV